MPALLASIGYFALGLNLLIESRGSTAPAARQRAGLASGKPGLSGHALAGAGGGNPNLAAVFRRGLKGAGQDPNRFAALSPTLARGPARGKVEAVRGLNDRVKRIRKLIRDGATDPAVRKLAGEIVAKRCPDKPGGFCVPEKDWRAEATAVFNYVRANVRYTRDSALADTYVHPARTLFDHAKSAGGIADCDDYAIVLGSLLMSIGHTVKLRVVAAKNGGGNEKPDWNHIYLRTTLPSGGAIAGEGGETMTLDASVNKPAGWEVPKNRIAKYRDFDV